MIDTVRTGTGTPGEVRRRVERPQVQSDPFREDEVRTAARSLLMRPLLVDHLHGDELRLVRRHRDELTRLFADALGYRLEVEPRVARLFKHPAPARPSRPWRRRSGAAFTPRTYALFAVTVAALTRTKSQLLLDELVAQVRSTAVAARLDVDLDAAPDRRALHGALTRLVELGVLVERDGDLEHWAERHTQSLLGVRRDVLGLLVSASLSAAEHPGDLLDDTALPSAAGGARLDVRRLLVESPVLRTDELDADRADWWRRNRNREREWFADRLGLELELRAEGAVAVDPADELSDLTFPGPGSDKHLALLLLGELVQLARSTSPTGPWAIVPRSRADDLCWTLLRRWGTAMRRDLHEDPDGAARTALDLLQRGDLVRCDGEDVVVHAAAARYAPSPQLVERAASGEQSLFDDLGDGG